MNFPVERLFLLLIWISNIRMEIEDRKGILFSTTFSCTKHSLRTLLSRSIKIVMFVFILKKLIKQIYFIFLYLLLILNEFDILHVLNLYKLKHSYKNYVSFINNFLKLKCFKIKINNKERYIRKLTTLTTTYKEKRCLYFENFRTNEKRNWSSLCRIEYGGSNKLSRVHYLIYWLRSNTWSHVIGSNLSSHINLKMLLHVVE